MKTLAIIFIFSFLISCNEHNLRSQGNKLEISASELYRLSTENQVSFSVTASDDWTIETDVPWLSFSKTSGSMCELESITVIFEANEAEEPRRGNIFVSTKNLVTQIMVLQAGTFPLLHICNEKEKVNADSSCIAIELTTNLSWHIEIPEKYDWISCDSLHGNMGAEMTIPVYIQANTSEEPRESVVYIHAGAKSDSVHIYQEGMVPILNTDADSIVVAADSLNAYFHLSTNQAWKIVDNPQTWFSIDTLSGTSAADSLLVHLSFVKNDRSDVINTATLTLTSGSLSKKIHIKQCAAMNREGIDITGSTPDLSVSYNWNQTIVTLCLPEGVNASDLQISIPNLKYNKQSAFSFTVDDIPNGAYSKIWSRINKKWMDDAQYFHIGQARSTGYMPTNTLSMTDGCGVEKRIPIGIALWPNKSNQWVADFMAPASAGKYYNYLIWNEAQCIVDFGGDVYFHNVDESKWDKTSVSSIQSGLAENNQTTYNRLGRYMKTMMRPDGNVNYTNAALNSDNIALVCDESDGWKSTSLYHPATDASMYHTKWFRYIYTASKTVDGHINDIRTNHQSANPIWYHFFIHTPDANTMEMLPKMEALWGASGDNSMWFTTVDELYEYIELREYLDITQTIEGNNIILTFKNLSPHVLPNAAEWHRDFSLVIKGLNADTDLKIQSSNNVYGVSFAPQNSSEWLLNINCNRPLIDLVEKYVAIYEESGTDEAKEDAAYFIQQLKPQFQTEYLERIE